MSRLAIILVAVATLAAGLACDRPPEGYDEALRHFDDFAGVEVPRETLLALARKLGARSEEVRVGHYGPTGQPDHTNYFAALSREGGVAVGIFDEAVTQITETHYEATFTREEFVWAVKCLRTDPPFGDRRVRYGVAVPFKIAYGPRDVTVDFVDGWIEPDRRWSTGSVTVNLAGTAVLEEKHALDFAIREGETAAPESE